MSGVIQCLWMAVVTVWLCHGSGSGFLFRDGENRLWPCGEGSYNRSLQCCCDLTVNDIPQNDCQCCGTTAYRWQDTKPDSCMGDCKGKLYHQSTQLCCERTVVNATLDTHVCCGDQAIDQEEEGCCGGQAFKKKEERCCGRRYIVNKRGYRCCAGMLPYPVQYMRCQQKYVSPKTSLNGSQHFRPEELCQRRLPGYDVTWPAINFRRNAYVHIRAIPESCKITLENDSSGGVKIIIPLDSFAMVGPHPDPDCLKSSESMELVIKVAPGKSCAREEELKKYLGGAVLDIYVKKEVGCWKDPVRPVLRLKEGHKAVIFIGGSSRAVMAQSLLPHLPQP